MHTSNASPLEAVAAGSLNVVSIVPGQLGLHSETLSHLIFTFLWNILGLILKSIS